MQSRVRGVSPGIMLRSRMARESARASVLRARWAGSGARVVPVRRPLRLSPDGRDGHDAEGTQYHGQQTIHRGGGRRAVERSARGRAGADRGDPAGAGGQHARARRRQTGADRERGGAGGRRGRAGGRRGARGGHVRVDAAEAGDQEAGAEVLDLGLAVVQMAGHEGGVGVGGRADDVLLEADVEQLAVGVVDVRDALGAGDGGVVRAAGVFAGGVLAPLVDVDGLVGLVVRVADDEDGADGVVAGGAGLRVVGQGDHGRGRALRVAQDRILLRRTRGKPVGDVADDVVRAQVGGLVDGGRVDGVVLDAVGDGVQGGVDHAWEANAGTLELVGASNGDDHIVVASGVLCRHSGPRGREGEKCGVEMHSDSLPPVERVS
nr:hypothetical protein CFP56_00757 [Quercus suber]